MTVFLPTIGPYADDTIVFLNFVEPLSTTAPEGLPTDLLKDRTTSVKKKVSENKTAPMPQLKQPNWKTEQKVDFQRSFISQSPKSLFPFAFTPNLFVVLTELCDENGPEEISCSTETINVLLGEPDAGREEVYTLYLPKGNSAEVRYRLCALFKDFLNEYEGFDEIDYKDALEAIKTKDPQSKDPQRQISKYAQHISAAYGCARTARVKCLAMLNFGGIAEKEALVFKAKNGRNTVRFVFKDEMPTKHVLLIDQIPLKQLLCTKLVDQITCGFLHKERGNALKERENLMQEKQSKMHKELSKLVERQKKSGLSRQKNFNDILDRVLTDAEGLDRILKHLASLDQDSTSQLLLVYIMKTINERVQASPDKTPLYVITLINRFFELFTFEHSTNQEVKKTLSHHYNRCETLLNYAEKNNVFRVPKNTNDTLKPDALWIQLSIFFNGCPLLNRCQEDRSWEAKVYYDLFKRMLDPIFGTNQIDPHRIFTAITMFGKARMDATLAKHLDDIYGLKAMCQMAIDASMHFPTTTIASIGGNVTALRFNYEASQSPNLLMAKKLNNWQSNLISVACNRFKINEAHEIIMMHLAAALEIMRKINYKEYPYYLPIIMDSLNLRSEELSLSEWTYSLRTLFGLFSSQESKIYYLDFLLAMLKKYQTNKETDSTFIEEEISALIAACEGYPMVSSKITSLSCQALAQNVGSFMALLSGSLNACVSKKIDLLKLKHELLRSLALMIKQPKVAEDVSLKSHYEQLTKEVAFSIKVDQLASIANYFKQFEELKLEEKAKIMLEGVQAIEKIIFTPDTLNMIAGLKDITLSAKIFTVLLNDIPHIAAEAKEKLLLRWIEHLDGFSKYPELFSAEMIKDHYRELLKKALIGQFSLKSALITLINAWCNKMSKLTLPPIKK